MRHHRNTSESRPTREEATKLARELAASYAERLGDGHARIEAAFVSWLMDGFTEKALRGFIAETRRARLPPGERYGFFREVVRRQRRSRKAGPMAT